MNIDFLQSEDGLGVAAVLALTELVKAAVRIPERWLPVVPMIVSLPVAFAYVWASNVDPSLMARATIMQGLFKLGPLAMISYKLWRTTVMNIGNDKDAEDGETGAEVAEGEG